MDDIAMRELAQHIRRTHEVREASFVMGNGRNSYGFYAKSYEAALVEAMVPEILHPLILAVLIPGYADVHEWCDRILDPYGEDVSKPARVQLTFV